MKRFLILSVAVVLPLCRLAAQDALQASENLFRAVQTGALPEAEKARSILAELAADKLKQTLNTQAKAKAFWLNIYNANVQYLLTKNPALFDDRDSFFKTEHITIAGEALSLDDIEHGIIRRSKNKYSFGYLGSIFTSGFEETFRLDEVDYRVHFALNCGAVSCPPIAFYEPSKLNDQLNKSTRLYLQKHASYNAAKNTAYAPVLCSWFSADFGGEDGVVKMMKEYGIVPAGKTPDIEYLEYDWTLALANYIDL